MPIGSKIISVTASESIGSAVCRIFNRSTGDIWTGTFVGTDVSIDLANNNIWGANPSQWTVGDILEISIFAVKKGGITWTLADIMNDVTITMNADTAVDIAF